MALACPPPAAAPSEGRVLPPAVRILYVDDDPLCSETTLRWFEFDGFDVTHASGPAEAERCLERATFDVVLSDICMPGNDELEWIDRLVRRPKLPPVALITGTPELKTAMRAANLPVAAYLLKPCDPRELSGVVRNLAATHRRGLALGELASEIGALVDGAAAELAAPLREKLRSFARTFAAESTAVARPVHAARAESPWRDAVVDAIRVLEGTKNHFRSRDLGALRRRLESLVDARS